MDIQYLDFSLLEVQEEDALYLQIMTYDLGSFTEAVLNADKDKWKISNKNEFYPTYCPPRYKVVFERIKEEIEDKPKRAGRPKLSN